MLAREPLVHFAAIGIVLFLVDAWRSPAKTTTTTAPAAVTAPADRTPIVVDARARAQIAGSAARRVGHTPAAADVAAETERWIDEEILYREAVARGLDRDDPVIHQRIAARMSFVLEQSAVVPEPSEPELRAWFDAHRERWTVPEHVDFTHVFVAGDDQAAHARIEQLADELEAGAAPERLGDDFHGGHRYRGRRLADLALAFGDSFVSGLDAQSPGTWERRRSRFGLHLVRVDRVEAGRPADFAAARLDVRSSLLAERRDALVQASIARLRAEWQVVRP